MVCICIHRVTRSIGEGQFGSVSMGVWTLPDGRHEVAVKMLKPEASDEARIKVLQEAAIMGQFAHKNVVRLEGVVTVGDPVSLGRVAVHLFVFFILP